MWFETTDSRRQKKPKERLRDLRARTVRPGGGSCLRSDYRLGGESQLAFPWALIGLAAILLSASVAVAQDAASSSTEPAESEGSACLGCHDQIQATIKQAVVHPAVEMGCDSCHVDHGDAPLGGVAPEGAASPPYLSASQPDLCWACHDAEDAQAAKAHGELPFAASICSNCHNPHGSESAKLLPAQAHPPFADRSCDMCHLAGEDGKLGLQTETASELCYMCHDGMQTRVTEAKSTHSLLTFDADACVTCHSPHASDHPRLLKQEGSQVCSDCHDAAEQSLVATHGGFSLQEVNCAGCHNPHASQGEKLLAAQEHPPFADRGCDMCHTTGDDGKISLVMESSGELCLMCHEQMQGRLETAASKHSLLAYDADACVTCHTPHASDHKRFLKRDVNSLCNECHSDVVADKEFVHKPVAASCVQCHDAHTSENAKNLHASGNDLCLECHGPKAMKEPLDAAVVALFDGKSTLSVEAWENRKFLTLTPDLKKGHPFPGHPVFTEVHGDRAGITCLSCHLPHAANGSPHLALTESPNRNKLCVNCH